MLQIILAICLILLSGFYSYSALLTGVVTGICLIIYYVKDGNIYKLPAIKNWVLYIPVLCVVLTALMTPFSVNKSQNIIGVLRGIAILLFMYFVYLLKDESRMKAIDFLPTLGTLQTLLGLIVLPLGEFKKIFWVSNRFGGFFQYANTNALFLALGVIVLLNEYKTAGDKRLAEGVKDYSKIIRAAKLVVLMAGILATGCRSVLLLLIVYGVYKSVKDRSVRKIAVVGIVLIFVVAIVAYVLFNNEQNVARILTVFKYNSTMLGRILYYKDAMRYLITHPWGLGYMGYADANGSFATGVYSTMFVHNDLIQAGLDMGLVPMILMAVYGIYQLVKGYQSMLKKELLGFMILSAMVDFHFQYMMIIYIAVLCLDLGEKGEKLKKKDYKENVFFIGAGAVLFLYFSIALYASKIGNYQLALNMYGMNTDALNMQLAQVTSASEADALADKILKINSYDIAALNSKVYAAKATGDYDQMFDNIYEVLDKCRYQAEVYQGYDETAYEVISSPSVQENPELYSRLSERYEGIRQKLADMEMITDPIAFKLRDKPVFTY